MCMVGFVLGNTLSENGGVTRGICDVTPEGFLQDITETRHIVKTEEGAAVETDEGLQPVDASHPVSMNMWGLTPEIFPILEAGFDRFLDQAEEDGGTGEYLLPDIIDRLLRAGKVRVKVLWSHEQWLGVTYQEDKAWVERALQKIRKDG